MTTRTQHILLIGSGNMGDTLLRAWAKKDVIPKQCITILEKKLGDLQQLQVREGWNIITSLDDVTITPTIILLAVKPQSMDELLPSLAAKFSTKPLYISIAAGKTLAYFAHHLGKDAAIVRAMPNTPALISQGVSVLCKNRLVSPAQEFIANELIKATGEINIDWLENESLMDVVTAISGSGPAYVFLFMESLIAAGIANGLPEDLCKKLVVHTVSGSALLANHFSISLPELRENVTSKGGTTEAALEVLMKNDVLKKLLADAVGAAIKRAKELA